MTASRTRLVAITLVVLLSCVLAPAVHAQGGGVGTGPGGVGSTDGTGNLKLWLEGDAGVYSDTACTTPATNGTSVACWGDQSGRGNSFLQSNTTSRPVLGGSVLNGQSALQFNGSSQYLDKTFTPDLNSSSFTLYLVTHTTGGSSTYRAPYASRCGTDDATRSGYNFYASSANLWEFWVLWLRNPPLAPIWSIAQGPTSANSAWHIFAGQYQASGLWQGLFVDGQIAGANTGIAYRPVTSTGGCPARIGAGGTEGSPGVYFPGDIAEVVYYDTYLNTAQRTLVDNYLSAKYNLTITNDKYTGNDVAYIRNVAGIGKEGAEYSDEGHSAGMIIRNGSFLLNTGDYILIGHAAPTNGNSTDDLPTSGPGWGDSNNQRWSRVWYLSKTDDHPYGGPVGIDFDFGEAGMTGSPTGDASNYRLLKRSGTSGQFTDIAQATSISGDRVTFDNVDSTLLGSYFTLATVDTSGSPLAVALASFTAEPEGDAVRLNWETTTELDTLGFTVYRSEAPNWELLRLAFVPSPSPGGSAGASYTYLDDTASAGHTYAYWLERLDLSGATTLYGPVTITLAGPTAVGEVEFNASSAGIPAGLPLVGIALAGLVSGLVAGRRRRSGG